MPLGIANAIVIAVLAYALVGLLFGVFFVTAAVGRVDHAAAGSGWAFRLMILPGAAALWPIMARKWLQTRTEARP